MVAFYNAGGGDAPNGSATLTTGQDPLLKPLNLTEQEQAALVAFMQSLCGDKIIAEQPELPEYEVWPGVTLGGSR